MSLQFSFTGNNFENILKSSGLLLPGMEKIIAIYNDETGNPIAKYVLREEPEILHELSIKGDFHEIQNLRTKEPNINWYSKGELLFETDNLTSELTLLNALDDNVLLLRFSNDFDDKYDLIYIFFNSNMGNFGISNSNKVLTAENKSIIYFILYNNFKSLLKTNSQNKSVLKSINENTRSLIRQTVILKSELTQIKKNYGESLINLSIQYLKDLTKKSKKRYKFSNDGLKKISQFKGNINNLKTIIEKSISYVDIINFEANDIEIIIHDSHINFYDYEVKANVEEMDNKSEEKNAKTILLLDKYERAANKVLSEEKKLTSANVGLACPVPISAPAISDALSKHEDEIFFLFEKYPDKWEILRNGFRPIKNLFLTGRKKKSKSA